MSLKVKILTLFPKMFPDPLEYSVIGKALKENKLALEVFDIRDYSKNKNKSVDDTPYGGGPGMVMRPDILADAIDKNIEKHSKIIYMSPRGKKISHKKIYELAVQIREEAKIKTFCRLIYLLLKK